jgi:hypothetical protein
MMEGLASGQMDPFADNLTVSAKVDVKEFLHFCHCFWYDPSRGGVGDVPVFGSDFFAVDLAIGGAGGPAFAAS